MILFHQDILFQYFICFPRQLIDDTPDELHLSKKKKRVRVKNIPLRKTKKSRRGLALDKHDWLNSTRGIIST
jgi:hypothetical protein